MHLEVVSLKLFFSPELFAAILTGIPGMHLAVMLFQLHFTLKGFTTFFTFIFQLVHTICSFQAIDAILETRKSIGLSVLCLTNPDQRCYQPGRTFTNSLPLAARLTSSAWGVLFTMRIPNGLAAIGV
jgi:hypothetical protein